jgi:hypothetical protein
MIQSDGGCMDIMRSKKNANSIREQYWVTLVNNFKDKGYLGFFYDGKSKSIPHC